MDAATHAGPWKFETDRIEQFLEGRAYLKPGVTLARQDPIARAFSSTECAEKMHPRNIPPLPSRIILYLKSDLLARIILRLKMQRRARYGALFLAWYCSFESGLLIEFRRFFQFTEAVQIVLDP